MAYSSLGAPLFSAFRYSFVSHLSGISFLPAVTRLLRQRNLPFNCDAPTEAKGNCFPYAVMQQLHRPAVRSTLSNEVKVLCEDYYNLRKAIVGFVKNKAPADEYYELVTKRHFEPKVDEKDGKVHGTPLLSTLYLKRVQRWF